MPIDPTSVHFRPSSFVNSFQFIEKWVRLAKSKSRALGSFGKIISRALGSFGIFKVAENGFVWSLQLTEKWLRFTTTGGLRTNNRVVKEQRAKSRPMDIIEIPCTIDPTKWRDLGPISARQAHDMFPVEEIVPPIRMAGDRLQGASPI